jgi:peptide/nickel transport system substrate-binding protein
MVPSREVRGGRATGRARSAAVVAVATIVVLVVLASACTGTEAEGGSDVDGASSDTLADVGPPVRGGTLRFGVGIETAGWNPHDNQWAHPGSLVGSSILEPLAALGPDLVPVPWLATSWTPNESFDSWTIELRDDVRFHDGSAFDAAAVKANFDDIKTAALTGIVWKPILGEVTVDGPSTVRVGLTQPFAAFPTSVLAAQTGLMMAPSMFSAEKRGSGAPVGTGPFVFDSWVQGSTFTATRNERYWQAGLPHLDAIEFKILEDSAAQATALQAGDVDLVFTAAIATVTQVPEDATVLKDWTSEPGMLITNTLPDVEGQPNPVANLHARLALARATDRQALADSVGVGVETPNSPFPPNSKWGMDPSENGYVEFDLEEARREVAAYEQETGRALAVTLSAPSGADVAALVQRIQSQWSEAGIETSIDTLEATTFISNVVAGKYQVALFNIYGSPDPDQNFHFWTAENANGPGAISINFTQFTTPEMDANLVKGRQSDDFEVRKAAYDAVVREINAAAVNIWTFSTPFSLVANPNVHGLERAAEVPFGNYQPKTWVADLWLSAA